MTSLEYRQFLEYRDSEEYQQDLQRVFGRNDPMNERIKELADQRHSTIGIPGSDSWPEHTNRLRLVDRSIEVDLWDVFHDKTIDVIKAELDAWLRHVDYGYGEDAKFRIDLYGYDGGIELYLDVYRDETDTEYDKRIAKEAAIKEKARKARETKKEKARRVLMESEAAERAEYERLRAKFEDS